MDEQESSAATETPAEKSVTILDLNDEPEAPATEEVAETRVPPTEEPSETGAQQEPEPQTVPLPRFKEVYARQKELERELEAERAKTAAAPPPAPAPTQGQDDARPQQDDFDDYEDYVLQLSRWSTRQELKAVREEEQRRAEQAHEESLANTKKQTLAKAIHEAKTQHQDFQEIIDDGTLPFTQDVLDVLADTGEMAPHLLYHLGKNPDELRRIAGMSPMQMARAIGALEARLQKPVIPQRTDTQAPPATKTVGTSPGANALEDMSMDEYIAHQNRLEFGRGG